MAGRKNIIFRCDANPAVGAGHVMRCLSVADAAGDDKNVIFVTADSTFKQVITSRGYEHISLDTDHTSMESELEPFLALIKKYRPVFVLVDSYYVTSAYLAALLGELHRVGSRLIYMDDILSFAYPADILINYNLYGPDRESDYAGLYAGEHMRMPRLLLGASYAPLRREFQNLPKRVVRKNASDILVSTGGSDPEHVALHLCRCIRELAEGKDDETAGFCRRSVFHFVAGAMNGDKEKLEELAAAGGNIKLYHNVADMHKLMSMTDLAVSAAGSTLYELCATATPTVTYILADNQIPGAEGFVKHGILSTAGDIRGDAFYPRRLLEAACSLARDYEGRCGIAQRQAALVDGKGAQRIMRACAP